MGQVKFMKTKWYPRPHESTMVIGATIEPSTEPSATICPLLMYDEAKGDPASYNSHPENASFASTDEPNCYPDSRIDKVMCDLELWMSKGSYETDKIKHMKVGFMVLYTSFDDIDAKDEKSGETIGTILELQTESTDRQCYPLWNGTDMPVAHAGANLELLPTNVPGLTTDQKIEGVDFDIDKYYDALQYYTNGSKLRRCSSGIRWVNIYSDRPERKFRIHIRPKTKYMNQYTQLSLMIIWPAVGTVYQNLTTSDTTVGGFHGGATIKTRANEWHPDFDHSRT